MESTTERTLRALTEICYANANDLAALDDMLTMVQFNHWAQAYLKFAEELDLHY